MLITVFLPWKIFIFEKQYSKSGQIYIKDIFGVSGWEQSGKIIRTRAWYQKYRFLLKKGVNYSSFTIIRNTNILFL